MQFQQIIFLIIMVVSIGLFISEKLRVDIVAMLIILSLTLTGLIGANTNFT